MKNIKSRKHSIKDSQDIRFIGNISFQIPLMKENGEDKMIRESN